MAEGWAEHPGTRHHGAHGGSLARTLDVPESEFLDFSQNINPLGSPPGVIEAARRALDEEAGTYPDLTYHRLREALGAYVGVEAGKIVPTNGGAEALFLAARAASTAAGGRGEAMILEPTFSEYAPAAVAAGLAPVRPITRRAENGFGLDLEALSDLDGTPVVFLCNPNNPTGGVLERREVLEVAAGVRDAGAVLVVDEAFVDFVPRASVADAVDDHLLVARSFTKFFAIPGLRLGCLICPDPSEVQALQPSWPVNAVAAAAGVAAAHDRGFAERSVREVGRLRDRLTGDLSAIPGITVFPGSANFLLVRGPVGLTEKLARRRVLVRGCAPFAGLGPEYFRVAVRGEEENRALVGAVGGAL